MTKQATRCQEKQTVTCLQHNWCNGEKLSGCRKLNSVVKLFPDGTITELALIGRLKRRSFLNVQNDKHQLHTCIHMYTRHAQEHRYSTTNVT